MTSPYHHQPNGKVEAAVKQVKRILHVSKKTGGDPYLALLTMQKPPQEYYETSPAQRLMSRRTKTDLPMHENLLTPQVVVNFSKKDTERKTKQQHFCNRGGKDLPHLDKGTRVGIQPTKLGDHEWRPATIRSHQATNHQVGTRSYEVETEGARTYIRNRRNLKETPW